MSDVPMPMSSPMTKLAKKTPKNSPMDSSNVKSVKEPLCVSTSGSADSVGLYFCAVSKSTIAMASFKIDSPKMTV